MQDSAKTSAATPRVSMLTVLDATPDAWIADTVRSMRRQSTETWQWVVALTDEAPQASVDAIREAASDRRIAVVEGGDDPWGAALAAAQGELVAALLAGDTLPKEALRHVLAAFDDGSGVDVAYTDHDLLDAQGHRHDREIKPDWSPERLRHHHYVGQLTVLRRALVEQVGGYRPELAGAVHHDLALRVTEQARRVVHVRRVLYHSRDQAGPVAPWARERPFSADAAVRAVQDHLDRVGVAATAEPGAEEGLVRVRRAPDLTTPVSVIIPTIGTKAEVGGRERTMVIETIRSIAARSEHRDVEYVVVYDRPTPEEVLDELRALRTDPGLRIKLIVFPEPFNFSAKCNYGAGFADGEVLLFLNDDMEAIGEGVIESLIAPLAEEGVGATGPKLRFEDGRIQSAGIQFGSGHIRNRYRLADPKDAGEAAELLLSREATGLTGACLAMHRTLFDEIGGFPESFPMNYNDVDLGLKILRHGRRLLWLHDVELFHFESVTRDRTVHPAELERLTHRWGDRRVVRERYSSGVR